MQRREDSKSQGGTDALFGLDRERDEISDEDSILTALDCDML